MIRQANITHPGKLFIGGNWVTPVTDPTIEVLDSGTGRPFAWVADACTAYLAQAVNAARAHSIMAPGRR